MPNLFLSGVSRDSNAGSRRIWHRHHASAERRTRRGYGMIVEIDFLDHWKTQALIKATNDPASPLLILRLWFHCQSRKTSRFPNLPDRALASICRWTGKPESLLPILLECGFVIMDGTTLVVHDWDETNRILVSAWLNGQKGGRPRKKRNDKKPTGKPTGNRSGTDPSPLSTLSNLSSLKEGVRGRFEEWVKFRKARGPNLKDWTTVFNSPLKKLLTFSEQRQLEILDYSITNGYQGLVWDKGAKKNDEQPQRRKTPEEEAWEKAWRGG